MTHDRQALALLLINWYLLLQPSVGLLSVMSPSLFILALLFSLGHSPAISVAAAPASSASLPRRLILNESTLAPPESKTTSSSTDFCSPSSPCNSQTLPHSRTLTIVVVAIFIACVILAFVSVYARRFCIRDGNLSPHYYGMEMCGGYGGNEALVKSLPVVKYDSGEEESKKMMKECAVCLSEFERGEMLRLLPACDHLFHKDCIDMWLFSHTTCPLCRISLIKRNRNSQSSGALHQLSGTAELQHMLSSHHAPGAPTVTL